MATQKIDDSKEKGNAVISDQKETQDCKSSDESKSGATNIQEQRKALLEQQRQKRFEREKQMGLHISDSSNSSSDTPLKSAISGSKNAKVASTVPKRVRFIDEDEVIPCNFKS